MKPTTKVFATLSLSAAVGKKISLSGETENIRGAGVALMDAGHEATTLYPAAGVEKQINKIMLAVNSLIFKPMDPQEILSMLMAGLSDIYAKCNPDRHEILDSVIYSAQACLDFYHDGIDHEKAYLRYNEWCAS